MDLKIAGSGQVVSGEYDAIHISGSGRLNGLVRCTGLHGSGSVHGEELDCSGKVSLSGSGSFQKDVKAGEAYFSGSAAIGGSLTVLGKVQASGSLRCDGSIKCGSFECSGSANVAGDVEAETVRVSGALNCDGLLNAEEIHIRTKNGMKLGSVGGSSITICCERERTRARLPLLSLLTGKQAHGCIKVAEGIEGDTVALESVNAPIVSGRVVAIGAGCHVDLVRYSEGIEISSDAVVGRTEKAASAQ